MVYACMRVCVCVSVCTHMHICDNVTLITIHYNAHTQKHVHMYIRIWR
jgi:hypothetical protein